MSHSFLAFFLYSIFFITFVRSDVQNLFLESLEDVQTEVNGLIAPGNRDQFYSQYYASSDLLKGLNFGELYEDLQRGAHDNHTCHVCNSLMGLAKMFLQNSQIAKVLAKSICSKVGSMTQRVCVGTIERMADPVVYILQHTKLSPPEVCGILLHPLCLTHLNLPMSQKLNWELPLPQRKEFKPLSANLKRMKMLHISDVHLDLWYTTGSNSLCNEPLCCRSTSVGHNRSAGFWSETEYSCDSPPVFAKTAIKQIADTHKDIDFIIWTGDSVPHDVWNTTQEVNLQHIKAVSDDLKASFKSIPLFPSLGNHESHPINLYIPTDVPKESNFSMEWLYNTLAEDYWSQWINTESAKKSFKRGGYYSALVNKGLKVISLNDNACDKASFWIAYAANDIDGQLEWLIQELDEAESNGRYAMIIGHQPAPVCFLAWSNNYFRIVERYQHLIVGTYFGHTHKDEIIMLYNKNIKTNETYPVSIGYIAPSITTYSDVNPGYRVFSLDRYGKPLDFTTYYTDILSDNKRGSNSQPQWKKAFSAKESYGLLDFSLKSWDNFITRANTDNRLTERYVSHYHRFSEAFVMRNNNSIESQRNILQRQRALNPINDL